MMSGDFESALAGSDVLPPQKIRRSYIYVIVHEDDKDPDRVVVREIHEHDGGRKAALEFINDIGVDKVKRAYKAIEILELKVKTVIHF
jgi:hypothetical protein